MKIIFAQSAKIVNISNQYLASQKEITKNLLQPNYENGKLFFAEEDKKKDKQ